MSTIGEVKDLAQLFVAHRSQLRRAAVAIVEDAAAADDVVQDAYLKLIAADKAAVVAYPLGYCFQVVRNMARDHRRRTNLETHLLAVEEEGEHVPSSHGLPEQQAISRQNLSILDKALMVVPVRTRTTCEMYFGRGMTQRDISKALGVSVGLVNKMIGEATAVLMQCRPLLESERAFG